VDYDLIIRVKNFSQEQVEDLLASAMEFCDTVPGTYVDAIAPRKEHPVEVPAIDDGQKFNFDFPVWLEHATDKQAMDMLIKMIDFCNTIPGAHSLGYNVDTEEASDEEL
jgi:hypothetical protein